FGCDDAAAADAVLDHDLLTQGFRQPRRHQPAGDVDVATGGEWDEELDRSVRPILCGVLRRGGAAQTEEGNGKRGEGGAEKAPARRGYAVFHDLTVWRGGRASQPSIAHPERLSV